MSWASVVAFLGLWLAGHGVLALTRPTRARSRLERHTTALGLGLAVLPALVTALIACAGPLSDSFGRGLLALLAVGGLVALVRARARGPAPPPSGLERAGLALLLVFAAFAVFAAGSMPVHVFDPVYHFAYKGKLVYHEGFGTASWTDVDGLVGRIITHPGYPPGIPALQALVGYVNGAFSEDRARPLMALFVLVPAGWLWAVLRPRSRAAAIAAALLWVSLPMLYYTKLPHEDFGKALYGFCFGPARGHARYGGLWSMPDGWTIDGAGDLPLATLFFGAFVHLWRLLPAARVTADRADVWIGGLLLGGALLMKNEGTGLYAVLFLALVLAALLARIAAPAQGTSVATSVVMDDAASDARRPRLALALPLAAVIGLGLTAAWLWAKREIPSIDENYPEQLRPANLWSQRGRAGAVWSGFWSSFTSVLRWNLLWPLFFLSLAWALARPRRFLAGPALAPALAVAGGCVLYFLILLVTPWNLEMLFETVIPGRLLLHVAPLAILSTALLLWRLPEEAGAGSAE